MKRFGKLVSVAVIALCALTGYSAVARADQNQQSSDPFRFLSRALSEAGAPALTTAEETALNTLITAYENALPDEPDTALEAARTAYRDAILAGNLAAATTQATIIANRTAALTSARLVARAQFEIGVLAVLNSNGQLTLLNTRFGTDRVLEIVDSLVGHGGGGRDEGGDGHRGR